MNINTLSSFSRKNRKELVLWLSIGVLLVLKIYQGDRMYWVEHFAQGLPYDDDYKWNMWLYHHLSTIVLFAIIPILIVVFVFREKVSDYGLKLGDWKFGLWATIISFMIMPYLVYRSSLNPEHFQFYHDNFPVVLANSSLTMFALWGLSYLPHYIGWEFFFRGYMLWGLGRKYGWIAGIMIPTILTTLMHIGKPQGETWGALIGGVYMGFLAYRTRSILWPLLFHFYLGLLNTYFCR